MPAKTIKYKLSATVPVVQYGNLIPEIELEGTNLDKLHEKAMDHMQQIWDQYSEKPLKKRDEQAEVEGIKFEEILSFTGEKILWSDYLHEYRALDGTVLTSGSTYAALTEKPFNSELLSEKSGNAWGVDKTQLADLWKMNGKIATDYGTTLHQCLETYMKHHELGAVVQEKKNLPYNYALPKNEYLRYVVTKFVNLFGTFEVAEAMISDVKNRMAGQIDGVRIVDLNKKICSLGDYKTNFEMKKSKLVTYSKQLNFYRTALENRGWTVEGMEIYHWNGSDWVQYGIDKEDIDMKLF